LTAGLISAACLSVYLAAGFMIASRRRALMWQKARAQWHRDDYARGSVKAQFIGTFLFWPFYLLISDVNGKLSRFVTEGDPAERARRLAERELHIRQMERELGIGREAK
jgi:hypothetical protein